jgi:NADH-quinone oxidoreductase subunit J
MNTTGTFSGLMLMYFAVGGLIGSSVYTIRAIKPIYALFGLLSAYFFSCILLLLQGLEYIALLYLAIYVGAIAILFVFMIAFVHTPKYGLKTSFWGLELFSLLFVVVVVFNGFKYLIQEYSGFFVRETLLLNPIKTFLVYTDSLTTIAGLFYVQYFIIFLLIGFFFLVTIIGTVSILVPYTESIKKK